MKRLGFILCLSLMIVLMAASMSFAADLTLEKTIPEEGKDDLNPQNVAIKLIFSEKISDPVAIAANAGSFAITDAKGKAVSFEPLYNEAKYPNEVWLQISSTLEQNSAYKVMVAEGMQSSAGNILNESLVMNFSTRNTEADTTGYMVLMVLMIVGMMVFTILDTKRKLKKESEAKEEEKRVNPYKVAKRTGKSVEEVVARTEKEKAQAEKRKARVAKRQLAEQEEDKAPARPGVIRVKSLRPISEKGYATPQSFIEERLARERAKAAEKEKARQQQTKSKGSKQKQRKKK